MRSTDPKEQAKSYFRSGARTFQVNAGWHFCTREGEQGPFSSKAVAERELAGFMRDLEELRGFQESREKRPVRPPPSARELKLVKLSERAGPRDDLSIDLPEVAKRA